MALPEECVKKEGKAVGLGIVRDVFDEYAEDFLEDLLVFCLSFAGAL